MTVSIDTTTVSFGVKMGALRLLGRRVEMYLKWRFLVSQLIEQQLEGKIKTPPVRHPSHFPSVDTSRQ